MIARASIVQTGAFQLQIGGVAPRIRSPMARGTRLIKSPLAKIMKNKYRRIIQVEGSIIFIPTHRSVTDIATAAKGVMTRQNDTPRSQILSAACSGSQLIKRINIAAEKLAKYFT